VPIADLREQLLNHHSGMMINNGLTHMVKRSIIMSLFMIQLIIPVITSAQSKLNVINNVSNKFESYCRSVPWEEIFLQTDRGEYVAGEEVWFRIFLIDRQSSGISSQSSIAYLELLDASNKPVVQKRIRVNSGTGQGQITLPDTLSTGLYTIRVYTSWMKNFLPANCYMREINVYNPFNIKSFKKIQYAFTATGADTIEASDPTGSAGHLKIETSRRNPGSKEINIFSDESYRSENDNLFYLFIQTRGKIDRFTSEKTDGNITGITIPDNSLTPGINQITIFDSKGNPLCEKLIYTPPPGKVEPPKINSADSFNIRSRISLEIDLPENAKNGDITISVTPVTTTSNEPDFNDYMVFGSEYGLLPHESIKGKRIGDLPSEEIDLLLSQLKSNWIAWDKILSDEKPAFRYKFEKEDHFIEGLVLTDGRQLSFPGEKILLSVPGKAAQFQYAVTNSEANFTFSVPINDNIQDLIMQPADTGKNYRIFIGSSFSDRYFPSRLTFDSVPEQAISLISKWSLNYQVGKIYGSTNKGDLASPDVGLSAPRRFYGKPDMELILRNFVKLPTMEEVFFELIPRVRLVKTGKEYEIVFLDYSGNRVYEEPPVMMIDGVIFNNASVIARLDPGVVEKIDIVRGIYHTGEYAFYGIVNVITNSGNFRLTLPEYATRISYKVTEPAPSFISPDYSDTDRNNNRNPDLRNTLYWNPCVKPVNDGVARVEFWSSDISTDYCITVQCFLPDGQIFSAHKTIKVR
jgi:hypothetical protein